MLPPTRHLLNHSSMQTPLDRRGQQLIVMHIALPKLPKPISPPTIEHSMPIHPDRMILTTRYGLKLNAEIVVWYPYKQLLRTYSQLAANIVPKHYSIPSICNGLVLLYNIILILLEQILQVFLLPEFLTYLVSDVSLFIIDILACEVFLNFLI